MFLFIIGRKCLWVKILNLKCHSLLQQESIAIVFLIIILIRNYFKKERFPYSLLLIIPEIKVFFFSLDQNSPSNSILLSMDENSISKKASTSRKLKSANVSSTGNFQKAHITSKASLTINTGFESITSNSNMNFIILSIIFKWTKATKYYFKPWITNQKIRKEYTHPFQQNKIFN